MPRVRIEVLELVDTASPGSVECSLIDASGTEWRFVEKLPVVLDTHESHLEFLPRPGVLACVIVRREEGDVITIETDVACTTGQSVFRVRAGQLHEV